jgi:hypothetical protein
MDAPKPTSKSSKKGGKGLFSKAKGLIRHSKTLDESDTTGDSDPRWKSENDIGSDPAQSPTTPASLPDKKPMKQRKPGRKATLESPAPASPGSLAGQKVRRANIEVLAGPPVENPKEMQSVNNDTEVAVHSPIKKKSKRRKSMGAMSETKEKVRPTRETVRKPGKRSNSQPAQPRTPGKSSRSRNTENTGEGVLDLMSHLGPPPPPEAEAEAELKDDLPLTPSGKARTTVDRDGKIRRVASKSNVYDEDDHSDGEHSKKSTRSKQSAKSAGSRRGKKTKEGAEIKKRRKPVPGNDNDGQSVFSAPGAMQRKGARRVDKKPSKDMDDHSAHSEKSENKRSKKKLSKRDLQEWGNGNGNGNGSDRSLRSDRSDKKLKKKISKREVLDASNHSKKKEASKRDLNTSDHSTKSERPKRLSTERRAGKRVGGLSPLISPKKPSKAKSVPNIHAEVDLTAMRWDSQSSELKATEAVTPPTSQMSLGKVGMVIGHSPVVYTNAAVGELEKEKEQLTGKIEEMNLENDTSQAEMSKLRKELREVKLESQRSHTERRELRADLREREFVIKESDMRVEALEKAVESQLDKMEEMEDELRRANEEVFILEEKLAHMEAVLAESAAVEGGGAKKEAAMALNRQQRLERRLEEKEKELAERENALKEERGLLLEDGKSSRTVDQLEQDNRMLLKAMNREKAEAEEKLQEKDAELTALKTELQRTDLNGDGEDSAAGGGSGSLLRKKDDQTSFLESELERLKKELQDRDLGDFDEIKRELQAAQNEGQAMKSKYEGAQRRNLILEDEIDHWKSVNCNLEDDLAEQKFQANNWRVKYEDVVETDEDEYESGGRENNLDFRVPRSGMSAADMAMSRNGDDSDDDKTVNTISGLWSKLTTPQTKKKSVGNTLAPGALNEVIARSTFH